MLVGVVQKKHCEKYPIQLPNKCRESATANGVKGISFFQGVGRFPKDYSVK